MGRAPGRLPQCPSRGCATTTRALLHQYRPSAEFRATIDRSACIQGPTQSGENAQACRMRSSWVLVLIVQAARFPTAAVYKRPSELCSRVGFGGDHRQTLPRRLRRARLPIASPALGLFTGCAATLSSHGGSFSLCDRYCHPLRNWTRFWCRALAARRVALQVLGKRPAEWVRLVDMVRQSHDLECDGWHTGSLSWIDIPSGRFSLLTTSSCSTPPLVWNVAAPRRAVHPPQPGDVPSAGVAPCSGWRPLPDARIPHGDTLHRPHRLYANGGAVGLSALYWGLVVYLSGVYSVPRSLVIITPCLPPA